MYWFDVFKICGLIKIRMDALLLLTSNDISFQFKRFKRIKCTLQSNIRIVEYVVGCVGVMFQGLFVMLKRPLPKIKRPFTLLLEPTAHTLGTQNTEWQDKSVYSNPCMF